jgi:hypothetical protein
MHADGAAHQCSGCPGLPNHFERAGRGDVGSVVTPARVLGEPHVSREQAVFGHARRAAQTEAGGHRALVHVRAVRERMILGMLEYGQVKVARVLEHAAQDLARADAVVGITDGDGACLAERSHLGEQLASQTLGGGGDGRQPDGARLRGSRAEPLRDDGLIVDRIGVRSAAHVGKPPGGGSAQPGREVLFVFEARLAEVGSQIDEPRHQPVILGIYDARTGGTRQTAGGTWS